MVKYSVAIHPHYAEYSVHANDGELLRGGVGRDDGEKVQRESGTVVQSTTTTPTLSFVSSTLLYSFALSTR